MIAATLHTPSNWLPSYDFDTIEVFDTLEQVIEVLFDRYSSNGKRTCPAEYLDGSGSHVYYPTFDPGSYFNCYLVPDWKRDEVYHPDELEGYRLEAHTAVHGGWKDYTVTLVRSDEGELHVVVQKAGI